jgi:predicted nucleic acid-binding Zn ribbon protein
LRKVYSPVGIVFKGSGFYSTDHRSPSGAGRPTSGEKVSESKKDGESSPPAPSDGKEKKTDAKTKD